MRTGTPEGWETLLESRVARDGEKADWATMRRQDPAPDAMPVSGNAKWTLSATWWTEHGPRTAEGIKRIQRALTKHDRYTKRAKAERAQYRELLRACRDMLAGL